MAGDCKQSDIRGTSPGTAAFTTLGCKVNQVETESLREQFVQNGWQVVDFIEEADIYVVNTCAVTSIAEKKSRALLRRAKRSNPKALVIACGCSAQVSASVLDSLPEVDLVVPQNDKEYLFERLQEVLESGQATFREAPAPLREINYTFHHPRTRGFIKIQDGCESFCSYCIVPLARGPVRSKHPQLVLNELRSMLAMNYREIVLNGIHLAQYGKDLDGDDLLSLLRSLLNQVPGDYRIRLGSIEPNEVVGGLTDLVLDDPRVCRHFHIPLQSGSNSILKAMNRKYSAERYLEILEEIYVRDPLVGLTADVMVGFPGEGEREFEETRKLIENSPLNDLHVFRYSPRPGTPAAVMEKQVGEAEKTARSQELIKIGRLRREYFLRSLEGHGLQVLTEEAVGDGIRGLTDNYVEILLNSGAPLNHLGLARVTGSDGRILNGQLEQHP